MGWGQLLQCALRLKRMACSKQLTYAPTFDALRSVVPPNPHPHDSAGETCLPGVVEVTQQ